MSPSRARRSLATAVLFVVALVLGVLCGPAGLASAAPRAPHAVVGGTDLGPNVYLFTPDMAQSDIQATVDSIADQQLTNQFGDQRYALMFAPGTYGTADDPLNFQVGYYTDVMGLGQDPGDVVINGSVNVYNQCDNGACIALNNFWRSLSNLTINASGNRGCYSGEFWATSQAASMRRVRVNSNGNNITLMDYCTGPSYASGGFIADSSFDRQVINGSQQQYAVRNANLQGGWSNGVWNQVFVGTQGAPDEAFASPNYYTTVAQTPVEKEKPYLYQDETGALRVFVPSAATNTSGTTWSANSSTPGTSLPISRFFVATPSSTVDQINKALRAGQDLLLTPGVYQLASTIQVTHPDTVVVGLGLPTLEPTAGNVAMHVAGLPGVDISDVIFDAGPVESPMLLDMAGSRKPGGVDPERPSAVQDVYFRVGGAHEGKVRTAFEVDTSNVVLDNIWSWRADHGTGVGWTQNTAATGLKVGGADVVAYGLFVEHYQGDEIVWNGANGKIFMLQNEMPYDPPSQAAWKTGKHFLGHAALVVRPGGTGFRGYGLGSYSFFNQGVDIHATQAFTLAPAIDAHVHDVLTVFLDPVNGSGGIDSVVNGTGGSSTAANPDAPVTVVDY